MVNFSPVKSGEMDDDSQENVLLGSKRLYSRSGEAVAAGRGIATVELREKEKSRSSLLPELGNWEGSI